MTLPTSFVLFAKNDQYIEWGPVIDGTTDTANPPTYLNALSGFLTMTDPNGAPVPLTTGGTPNQVPFVYVPTSNGIYRALIEQIFNPPAGGGYTLIVDLTGGGSEPTPDGHWEFPAVVKVRKL